MNLVIAASFVAAAAGVLNLYFVVWIAERLPQEHRDADAVGTVPTAA